MPSYSRFSKRVFLLSVVLLIALNLYTFIVAIPEMYTLTPGINTSGNILAKDFSAYYVSAWRLWNNPLNIYTFGALGGGEPDILPFPQGYKYLPSFLLISSPLLMLDYDQALMAFNIFQFMLLPVMAFLIYRLLESRGLVAALTVAVIALLMPFPTTNLGFSVSYFWQWGEGQAKVLGVFLLLLSFYLGHHAKHKLSGIFLALGFFDPRFGLLALPLFVMYNRKNIRKAVLSALGTLVLSNLVLFHPSLAFGFLSMVWRSGVSTPLYYYALIPFLTLVSLMVINFKELVTVFDYFGLFARFTGSGKGVSTRESSTI